MYVAGTVQSAYPAQTTVTTYPVQPTYPAYQAGYQQVYQPQGYPQYPQTAQAGMVGSSSTAYTGQPDTKPMASAPPMEPPPPYPQWTWSWANAKRSCTSLLLIDAICAITIFYKSWQFFIISYQIIKLFNLFKHDTNLYKVHTCHTFCWYFMFVCPFNLHWNRQFWIMPNCGNLCNQKNKFTACYFRCIFLYMY